MSIVFDPYFMLMSLYFITDIPLPPLPAQLEVSVAKTPEIIYKHII